MSTERQPQDNHETSRHYGQFVPAPGKFDKRTREYRRWKEMVAELTKLVGGDLSPIQQQIVRRAAGLSMIAECAEALLAQGKPVDELAYVRTVGAYSRCLRTLGLVEGQEQDEPYDGLTLEDFRAGKAA